MFRYSISLALALTGAAAFAQNDLDAIRYARVGSGGTSRFMAMGGAFGAVGADLSCAAYNPAGLGLFRKGEISFSASLRMSNNSASLYNTKTYMPDATGAFNNFGIAVAWPGNRDPESRHVLAFTNSQVQNFNTSVRMMGYTNSSSIAKDMLNFANADKTVNNLQNNYEGLGFDTYLLDTANNSFFSNVDLKRAVKQTRDIVTSGRVNDLNFSYAYSHKDEYYIGVSVGVPQISFESTTTHAEADDKDSMRVAYQPNGSYTSTYIDGLPAASSKRLGFNSLSFTEYYKTTGSGVNLKIGGIVRVNDGLRLGAYYHTPTFYNLTDSYYNSMSVSYDADPSHPISEQYPGNTGVFNYQLVTPSRLGLNAAFLVRKKAVIGVDYEFVNYKTTQLKSSDVNTFSDVNEVLKTQYKLSGNFRIGAELNTKPFMVRAGYLMQGSPFGEQFSGDYVRHTFSLGFGIRTKGNFYFDVAWAKTISNESYQLFTTLNTASRIGYNATMISATAGIKF